MEDEGGGHDPVAVSGGPVEASARNLGDEAVAAKLGDEPRDTGTATVGLLGVGGWSGVEASHQIGVAEAGDGVTASQHGPEQAPVSGAERVEPGVVAPVAGPAPAQGVERRRDALAFEWGGGQGVQVAMI